MKKIGFVFSFSFLFLIIPSTNIYAKKYTIDECKRTIEKLARQVLTSVSSGAPSRLLVKSSDDNPRLLVISGKIIPDAYLVIFGNDPNISHDTYLTKEVQKKLDDTPMQIFTNILCPRNLNNPNEEKKYKDDLLNAMATIDNYVKQQMVTPIFKDFFRQFIGFFNYSLDDFARYVRKSLSDRYSTRFVWSIKERFIDYSFEKLSIVFDYCAFLLEKDKFLQDQIEQKQKECLEKQSKQATFIVQVKGRTEEEISNDLAKEAKKLNQIIYMYMRILVAKENKETI